jgi:hypothetical protein
MTTDLEEANRQFAFSQALAQQQADTGAGTRRGAGEGIIES